MSVAGWVLAVIAAMAVGLAKGGLSMVAVLSVPLLSLVMSPVQAAGLLLPVYIVSDIGGLVAYWRDADWHVLCRLWPGALVGIWFGWLTASIVPVAGVEMIVGLIGLAFALNALLRRAAEGPPRPADWAKGSFWGTIAGYTSFVSHSGAAPFQVYVQPLRLSSMGYAGTATVFFAVVNAIKLVPYAALGQLSPQNLGAAAVLMPVALASVWLGVRLVRIMPAKAFYLFITWALLLVSIKLIWDGGSGLWG
ncbi:sulfite exporter TauE/SafE family protein [Paracoccus sp. M683]|nr:sulfite exporter TauE/SafE family protein [Paracoccus sp. M683]